MAETVVLGIDDIEVQNTTLEEIDSESVNLIFVGIDGSGSMTPFVSDMGAALANFKDAIAKSKEADEILVARADFSDNISVGGYKKITDLVTSYSASSLTALYQVITEGADKLTQYMEHLKRSGMRVKAVFAIFSDGENTVGGVSMASAAQAVQRLNEGEIVTAFISFGGGADSIAKSLNFKNILKSDGTASELRKAFACLSKSVVSASKSVTAPVNDFFNV